MDLLMRPRVKKTSASVKKRDDREGLMDCWMGGLMADGVWMLDSGCPILPSDFLLPSPVSTYRR